jgi:ribosome maturation factor RimP
MFETVQNLIIDISKPALEEFSVNLIEVMVKRRGRVIAVEILADRENGGITIDECAQINKKIAILLEQEEIIDDEYVVEVSSPGLDRPLKTGIDFRRVVGRMVRVHLTESIEDKVEHSGIVKAVAQDCVTLNGKIKSLVIPFEKIQKAMQII